MRLKLILMRLLMSFGPSFSVIIPTFNRSHTLSRAINSVLNQKYKNFELIVIDDGSTDDTWDVLAKYPDIKILKQKNYGVSHARNRGINVAKGEWIAFLDSDDEWLPQKLELQAKYIMNNPEINWVHGEEIWIRNGVRVNQMKKHKKGGGDQFLASLKLCAISPSTVVIKKTLLSDMGNFREDYLVCEDYDLWLKISSVYPIGFIQEPIIKKYGGHGDQLSAKYFAMDYFRVKSLAWIFKNRSLSDLYKEELIKVFSKKCKILIKGYQKHGNNEKAKEVTELFNSLSPTDIYFS